MKTNRLDARTIQALCDAPQAGAEYASYLPFRIDIGHTDDYGGENHKCDRCSLVHTIVANLILGMIVTLSEDLGIDEHSVGSMAANALGAFVQLRVDKTTHNFAFRDIDQIIRDNPARIIQTLPDHITPEIGVKRMNEIAMRAILEASLYRAFDKHIRTEGQA